MCLFDRHRSYTHVTIDIICHVAFFKLLNQTIKATPYSKYFIPRIIFQTKCCTANQVIYNTEKETKNLKIL